MKQIYNVLSVFAFPLIALSTVQAGQLSIPEGKAGLPEHRNSGREETFSPVMEGNIISAGTKKIQLFNNFRLSITENGRPLAESAYVFTLTDRKTGKTTWHALGATQPGMYKVESQGNKRIFEQKFSIQGYTWDFARQETELMPDGLVKITFTWKNPDPEKYTLKQYGYFFNMPYSVGGGKKLICDGKQYTIPESQKTSGFASVSGREPHTIKFFPDDPAKKFSISGQAGELAGISCFALKETLRFDINENIPENKLIFTVDIRKGTRSVNTKDVHGNVNFRLLDNLTMPDPSGKNLIQNSSFEQGVNGYFVRDPGYHYSREKWESTPYAIDKKEKRFGSASLRIATIYPGDNDYRSLTTAGNIATQHTAVAPGTYTLSFYIKGDHPGEQTFNAWVSPYNYGPYNHWLAVKNGKMTLPVSKEWKRYFTTFRIDSTMPLIVRMNAVSSQKRGSVWVDGIQVEKGDKSTEFDAKPAEAELVSSSPDNFISAKMPVQAKLLLQAAPDASGKGKTVIRNFYGEKVFEQEFAFKTDGNGCAKVELDLDKKHPGKGIFMLRTDYSLDDGRSCYDLHRLTILDFLENKHPHRFLFSDNYGGLYEKAELYQILDRYRKVGFGYKAQDFTGDPLVHNTFEKYGIPISEIIIARLYRKNGKKHFGVGETLPFRADFSKDDSKLLFRDFNLDSNGTITPEYLDKVRKGCEKIARKYLHVTRWQFSNEMGAAFPNEWWSEEGTPEKRVERFARILKAFAEGIKAGNPNAKVSADCPWNMNPTGGIQETEDLLRECNKLGFKFDRLACHTYRVSPESPDLDADTALYLEKVSKLGYTEEPLFWSEMMHWGPYTIPPWGVVSADWMGAPRTWIGGSVSYDMGWTEKISAAWRARAWLVALKYSDRVKTACSSSDMNNFAMDLNLTPFASQVIPNTLGHLLGDSKFRKDIRFAAYIRAYLFEDAQKRPVAAVWCHLPKLDEGRQDAPVAEADFGTSLESVIDLMNNKRSFVPGKIKFAVTPFPLFFRGKPGSLDKMIGAFENAVIVSGDGVSPLLVSANPSAPDKAVLKLKNLLSVPFSGTIGNTVLEVGGAQTENINLPLPEKLSYDKIVRESLPFQLKAKNGGNVAVDLSFRASLCKRVPDTVTLEQIQWNTVPGTQLANAKGTPLLTGGIYRTAWNRKGFFLRVEIKDRHYSHIEFTKPGERWANDALQVYFDTFADARSRQVTGYDDNDYDYMILPDATGTSCSVYRNRMVDWQLGLGTSQGKTGTFAKDISTKFVKTGDGYIYEVFFPAKDILPIQLKEGYAFGFGVYVPNADNPNEKSYKRVISALTNADGETDCYNKPHLWPALLLWK